MNLPALERLAADPHTHPAQRYRARARALRLRDVLAEKADADTEALAAFNETTGEALPGVDWVAALKRQFQASNDGGREIAQAAALITRAPQVAIRRPRSSLRARRRPSGGRTRRSSTRAGPSEADPHEPEPVSLGRRA